MLAIVNRVLQERGLTLKSGAVVDATLMAAPSATKNIKGERDSEICQIVAILEADTSQLFGVLRSSGR